MEVFSVLSKFNVKSKLSNYQVNFTYNYLKVIKKYNTKNNIFIFDNYIYKKFIKKKINIKNFKTISTSEKTKSFDYTTNLLKFFIKKRINKKNKIILVGGGSLQDLVSFTCSIYHRGIEWIFLPTTLLSQADSCIGGKNSINFDNFKNIVGNFYPPVKIYVSKKFIEKLPERNLYDGLGEIFHILAVYNKKKIILIDRYLQKKITLDHLIQKSLLCKKYFIEKDEFDKTLRKLLNFGHTFGHAIEGYSNFKVPHGQAVASGCMYAIWMSQKLGHISEKKADYYKKTLRKIILHKNIFSMTKLSKFLLKDKKAENNKINFILINEKNKMFIKKFKIDQKFINIFNDFKY